MGNLTVLGARVAKKGSGKPSVVLDEDKVASPVKRTRKKAETPVVDVVDNTPTPITFGRQKGIAIKTQDVVARWNDEWSETPPPFVVFVEHYEEIMAGIPVVALAGIKQVMDVVTKRVPVFKNCMYNHVDKLVNSTVEDFANSFEMQRTDYSRNKKVVSSVADAMSKAFSGKNVGSRASVKPAKNGCIINISVIPALQLEGARYNLFNPVNGELPLSTLLNRSFLWDATPELANEIYNRCEKLIGQSGSASIADLDPTWTEVDSDGDALYAVGTGGFNVNFAFNRRATEKPTKSNVQRMNENMELETVEVEITTKLLGDLDALNRAVSARETSIQSLLGSYLSEVSIAISLEFGIDQEQMDYIGQTDGADLRNIGMWLKYHVDSSDLSAEYIFSAYDRAALPVASPRSSFAGLMTAPNAGNYILAIPDEQSKDKEAVISSLTNDFIRPDGSFDVDLPYVEGEDHHSTQRLNSQLRKAGNQFIAMDWTLNRMITSNEQRNLVFTDIQDWRETKAGAVRSVLKSRIDMPHQHCDIPNCLKRVANYVTDKRLPTSNWSTVAPLFTLAADKPATEILRDPNSWDLVVDTFADFMRFAASSLTWNSEVQAASKIPVFQQYIEEHGDGTATDTSWGQASTINPIRESPLTEFRVDNFVNPPAAYFAGVLEAAWNKLVEDGVLSNQGRVIDTGRLIAAFGLKVTTCLQIAAFLTLWHNFVATDSLVKELERREESDSRRYGAKALDVSDVPEGWTPDPLPNVQEHLQYMPHQFKTAFIQQQALEDYKKNGGQLVSFLKCDAGGGKTISIITDIIRHVTAGTVKVPAVFCPNHLLANYVEDTIYATDGKWNVIPLNNDVFKDYGEDYYVNMASNMPPNTFFVIDYDFAKLTTDYYSVGSEWIEFSPYAQFIRSMGIDGAWLDESQYLKNMDNSRRTAVVEALSGVPFLTNATGTWYQTNLSDVLNQFSVLDPTAFGDAEKYINNLLQRDMDSISVRKAITSRILNNSSLIRSNRKEWAAMLPPKKVEFHFVKMSKEQATVYNTILSSTLEEMQKDPALAKMLTAQDDNDEESMARMEALLQKYLQRLEMFLGSPENDKFFEGKLDPHSPEAISPKLATLEKLIRSHIDKGLTGKILIFTSYNNSAKTLFAQLPEDLRKQGLHYTAAQKERCRKLFATNDNIKFMIGTENSINTGVNAQNASRLIRIEARYSPGELEQGESRVNRPNLKSKEFRDMLYMDWILCDETIDITKSSRLMSKVLDMVKFDNADSPIYQVLPNLEPLRMNFNVIAEKNTFDDPDLSQYLQAYLKLENEVKEREIEEYRAKSPNLELRPQPNGGLLKGSAMINNVPYIPLGGVYKQRDLNLTDCYTIISMSNDPAGDLKGLRAHTTHGDGVIVAVNNSTIHVKLDDGRKVIVKHGACYVINSQKTSTKAIKELVAEYSGLPLQNVNVVGVNEVEPDEVVEKPVKPLPKKTEVIKAPKEVVTDVDADVEPEEEVIDEDVEETALTVYPSFMNNFMSLAINMEDIEDVVDTDVFEKLGFESQTKYAFLELKRWQQAKQLREKWDATGIKMTKSFRNTLIAIEEDLRYNRTSLNRYTRLYTRDPSDFRVFEQQGRKRLSTDRVRAFFCIEDEAVYVCVDTSVNPGFAKLRSQAKVSGTSWTMPSLIWTYLATRKSALASTLRKLKKALPANVVIENFDEALEDISVMKLNIRNVKE